MSLADPTGRLSHVADASLDTRLSPDAKHLGHVDGRGATFLRLNQPRQVVAFVPGAMAFAFDSAGREAIVARFPGELGDDHGCGAGPTVLERVDLRLGTSLPVATVRQRVMPHGAHAGEILVSILRDDCSASRPAFLTVDDQRLVPLPADGLVVAHSSDLQRVWVQRLPDSAHPRAWGAVYGRNGALVGQSDFVGEAAFGPSNRLVYSQIRYGKRGTAQEYVAQHGDVLLGESAPRRGDTKRRMLSEGDFVWDQQGSGFGFRRAADGDVMRLQAWYCQVNGMHCRALPLVWDQDVELLGIVSSVDLA